MNDLEYLNQISAGVTQQQKPTSFFDKKMKIIFGALAGVVLLLIVLVASTGSSSSTPEITATSELGRLYNYSNELTKTVTTYNGSVRSSSLRSTGASLSTLLAEISTSSASYLGNTAELVADPKDTKILTELNATLEKARLNGVLDRNYAHEMYYQIRYLIIIENSIATKTTDQKLKTYLSSSEESLTRLEETFDNFSESN